VKRAGERGNLRSPSAAAASNIKTLGVGW